MATQLKYKQIAKDSLFYGRWQYCISFYLPEVSVLKNLDYDHITALIERRRMWIETSVQRWKNIRANAGSVPAIIGARQRRSITENDVENLHELATALIETKIPFKLVTSVDQGWIYTNSKKLINKLASNLNLSDKQYSEAVINRPKNTIKLANPGHTHRSYFKSTKLTDKEKDTLITFFVNQSDSIRVSPAFSGWLLTPYHRSQDYFFMDHNGESWLVLLALIKPGFVRKTMEIVPA